MTFSQNLKKIRKEKNLTQEQLADMLGISPQAVSKWETSETYPDGALLVPLSSALGTSLDALFGNSTCSMSDVSRRIINIINNTPKEQRFHIARDICWQIEKGFFDSLTPIDTLYSPDELTSLKNSSYVLNDYGFTLISNGNSPFFSIFPKYNECYSIAINDGEEMRIIFEKLSSPDTMRAVLFIHKEDYNYVFEAEVLADACDIKEERLEKVLKDLLELRLIEKMNLEIDDQQTTLYATRPTHRLIALLLMTKEFNYTGPHTLQADQRQKRFLR